MAEPKHPISLVVRFPRLALRGARSNHKMQIKRGTYDGASNFAYFDTSITLMTEDEMRSLLHFILQRATPGEKNAEVMQHELAVAEQLARENGVKI